MFLRIRSLGEAFPKKWAQILSFFSPRWSRDVGLVAGRWTFSTIEISHLLNTCGDFMTEFSCHSNSVSRFSRQVYQDVPRIFSNDALDSDDTLACGWNLI